MSRENNLLRNYQEISPYLHNKISTEYRYQIIQSKTLKLSKLFTQIISACADFVKTSIKDMATALKTR